MSILPAAATSDQPETGGRESKGGPAKPSSPVSLPDGITAVTSLHYRVGPYSYSRLDDALAELGRQSDK